MKIVLDIPNEFIAHYKDDKFVDSLKRIEYDLQPCAYAVRNNYMSGLYEVELIEMLVKVFSNSRVKTEATLKDVVLGNTAGKKAVIEALRKSCDDQAKVLKEGKE